MFFCSIVPVNKSTNNIGIIIKYDRSLKKLKTILKALYIANTRSEIQNIEITTRLLLDIQFSATTKFGAYATRNVIKIIKTLIGFSIEALTSINPNMIIHPLITV
jgi:hypothetical protein